MNYDKEIIDLYCKNFKPQNDFLNMVRGGDTWQCTGWEVNKSRWWLFNLFRKLTGLEKLREAGYWYYANGWKSNFESYNDKDTFIWTSNYTND